MFGLFSAIRSSVLSPHIWLFNDLHQALVLQYIQEFVVLGWGRTDWLEFCRGLIYAKEIHVTSQPYTGVSLGELIKGYF